MVDLKWLAGFFDADGCVTICKTRRGGTFRHILRVEITNCYRPIIAEIHEQFGGSMVINHLSDRKRRDKNEWGIRDTYLWATGAIKALDFLLAIRPYSRIKAREIDVAIVFQRHVSSTKKGLPVSTDILAYRDSLASKCSAFKRQRYAANS